MAKNRSNPRASAHAQVGSLVALVKGSVSKIDESSVVPSSTSGDRTAIVSEKVYSTLLDRVFQSVIEESEVIEGQRSMATALAAELQVLSATQRRLVIGNSARYRSWALVEHLLITSRNFWFDDPHQAEELASLARDIADHLEVAGYRSKLLADLRSEAWSYIGNSRRIYSDLVGAEEAFRMAEALLDHGTGDSMERARFLDLKASFLRASRRFDEADEAHTGAIRGFRAAADKHLEGRALLNYAKLLRDRGETEKSLLILKQAEPLLDFERDPYLEFIHKFKVLFYLVDLNRLDEARRVLPEVRDLARAHAPRLDRLRLLWTEGVLRRDSGEKELAEEALWQVREGFIAEGFGYDVALVSLDLAVLYLNAGYVEKVHQLASETMPIFASLNVHRELIMAWSLFLEAARQHVASQQMVHQLSAQIRSAREVATPVVPDSNR